MGPGPASRLVCCPFLSHTVSFTNLRLNRRRLCCYREHLKRCRGRHNWGLLDSRYCYAARRCVISQPLSYLITPHSRHASSLHVITFPRLGINCCYFSIASDDHSHRCNFNRPLLVPIPASFRGPPCLPLLLLGRCLAPDLLRYSNRLVRPCQK